MTRQVGMISKLGKGPLRPLARAAWSRTQHVLGRVGLRLARVGAEGSPDLELYRRVHGEGAVRDRAFINIGAGDFAHPAWRNVDKSSDWYQDHQQSGAGVHIEWDLLDTKPLPVEDASIEVVYTSHTVEHVPDDAVARMFQESFRILRPGGVFRVTTPDMDLEYRAYVAGDRDYFYWIDASSRPEHMRVTGTRIPLNQASTPQIFLNHFAATASTVQLEGADERISDEELAELFRTLPRDEVLDLCTARCVPEIHERMPGLHRNWWTADKMTRFMERAGFVEAARSGYGQSRCPVLRDTSFFDTTHPRISLYMECRKP